MAARSREEPDNPATPHAVTNGGSRPVPDPTALTDAAIAKAVTSIREKIGDIKELEEVRISSLGEELRRLRDIVDGRPAAVVAEVTHLRELVIEKINKQEAVTTQQFAGIEKQFVERDKRTEQLSQADKTVTDLISEIRKNTDSRIDDIKTRLDKGEGSESVAGPASVDLIAEVKALRLASASGAGKSEGITSTIAILLTIVGLAIGIVGTIAVFRPSPPVVIERAPASNVGPANGSPQ